MKYNDLVEIYSIIHGFKNYLLPKEELIQIINEQNRENLLGLIKVMFSFKEELNTIDDLEKVLNKVLYSYVRKINHFLRTEYLKMDIGDFLLFKQELNDHKKGFDVMKKINNNLKYFENIEWESKAMIIEWFNFLFTIYLIRLKEKYKYQETFFQIQKIELIEMSYNNLINSIINRNIKEQETLFRKFKSAFKEDNLQAIFERGKIIFYSFLLKKMKSFSLDDVPTLILGVLFLYMRQTEFILASLNSIEMGIEKERLETMLI